MKSLNEMLGQEWIDDRFNLIGRPPDSVSWRPTGMASCELHFANGGSVESIREGCLLHTRDWVAKVANMSFTMKKCRIEAGMQPSVAERLARMHGGTWWKAGQHQAGVEYEALEQPSRSDMPGVWMLAAVSGDRDLAKTVAAPYRVPSPEQLHALSHIREYCLRHALAGDDEALAALGQKLEPGYPADFPPQFIEFPLGIIKSDPDMILSGLKKSNSRFRGKWDEKKWRAWYDEPRNRHRRPDTWEECAKANKDALFNLRFFLNWWALAWLNIASWCGMDEVFKNARSFSPWVPIELAAGRPS